MVMIVKDHEKQAHGFISVTRLPWQPADLRQLFRAPPAPGLSSARGRGRRPLAAAVLMGPQRPHFCLGLAPI